MATYWGRYRGKAFLRVPVSEFCLLRLINYDTFKRIKKATPKIKQKLMSLMACQLGKIGTQGKEQFQHNGINTMFLLSRYVSRIKRTANQSYNSLMQSTGKSCISIVKHVHGRIKHRGKCICIVRNSGLTTGEKLENIKSKCWGKTQ